MAEQEQDKSEEASPHKKQEARRKGTVAKSMEMQCAALIGAAMLVWLISGPTMIERSLSLFSAILAHSTQQPFSLEALSEQGRAFAMALLKIMLPLYITLVAASMLTGLSQAGLVWSSVPLKPDWSRLNPVEGLKKLFSMRVLFEAAKTFVKFAVLTIVLIVALQDILLAGWGLLQSGVTAIAQAMAAGMLRVWRDIVVLMLVIAVVDWLFVKRALAKKLRMSKREVREEYKRREGDARIKAKLRELRLQFLQKVRSLTRVKDADVLVVNPTHFALAIQFKRGQMAAPWLLSKGAGEIALKMRHMAYRHGVPIFENKTLARDLYHDVDVNEWIPEQHYAAVAQALIWAYQIRPESHR